MFSVVPAAPVHIGPYLFYGAKNILIDARYDRVIKLTKKESTLLLFLYKANNRPVSQDTILRNVWGYNVNVVSDTIKTHICRLRKKMGDAPSKLQLLSTESGGYRLEREPSFTETGLR